MLKEKYMPMNIEGIDAKNNEAFIDLITKFWGFDGPSMNFIKERIVTDKFDFEFSKLFGDSKDQRIRWDIDFSESAFSSYYSEKDDAYKMFRRKFAHVISLLDNAGYKISYSEFMNNKIVYKKNETKLKKVFEVIYDENKKHFAADAGVRENEVTKESIAAYIVKAFESIGTVKKPSKKLQLVLSLNICDWMLASTGGEISSCLNMEGGNKFWSGLPYMAGDPNRAMLYITDGQKKNYEGITVDNAMTRTWVILTKDDKKSIIRWYPNEIINTDAINGIIGKNDFQFDMKTNGKNEIEPLRLASGLTTTIYMDRGCWEANASKTKFVHTLAAKGCYQLFSEDLNQIKEFNFVRPFGGGDLSWRISNFKSMGIAIDDTVPVSRCKSCGMKRMSSKSMSSVCVPCFNKNYFSCACCSNTRELSKTHYDGFIIKSNTKIKAKVCSECKPKMKICECCETPILGDSSAHKTSDGKFVCNICLEDKTNGYKRCNSCGKVSKTKVVLYYKHEEKSFGEYCDEHLPKDNDDVEKNGSTYVLFTRKPFKNKECSVCHARLPKEAMYGSTCITCATLSKNTEYMEV